MLTGGTLRACWSVGLAFILPGAASLLAGIAGLLMLLTPFLLPRKPAVRTCRHAEVRA